MRISHMSKRMRQRRLKMQTAAGFRSLVVDGCPSWALSMDRILQSADEPRIPPRVLSDSLGFLACKPSRLREDSDRLCQSIMSFLGGGTWHVGEPARTRYGGHGWPARNGRREPRNGVTAASLRDRVCCLCAPYSELLSARSIANDGPHGAYLGGPGRAAWPY